MGKEKTTEERYNEGLIIVKEFFTFSDKEIKEKLLSILGDDDKYSHILEKGSRIDRTISNEIPAEIIISFYDSISIHPFGITYCSEHGVGHSLVTFNKHFKL